LFVWFVPDLGCRQLPPCLSAGGSAKDPYRAFLIRMKGKHIGTIALFAWLAPSPSTMNYAMQDSTYVASKCCISAESSISCGPDHSCQASPSKRELFAIFSCFRMSTLSKSLNIEPGGGPVAFVLAFPPQRLNVKHLLISHRTRWCKRSLKCLWLSRREVMLFTMQFVIWRPRVTCQAYTPTH